MLNVETSLSGSRNGDLGRDGYAVVPGVLTPEAARKLAESLSDEEVGSAGSRRGGSVYARRNVLALSGVRAVVNGPALRALIADVLGPSAFPVRGILFDKTPDANWNVVWHQDLAVPVRERREAPGWGGWSVKAGVAHAHPPSAVLERMLTVRLHLDPCGPENGPLRVLPGTHRYGRLSDDAIADLRRTTPEVVCTAGAGDALLMRPLLLHASSAAQLPGHRRVLHVEWAAEPLPDGLLWADGA